MQQSIFYICYNYTSPANHCHAAQDSSLWRCFLLYNVKNDNYSPFKFNVTPSQKIC